jgi:hypothetical protein
MNGNRFPLEAPMSVPTPATPAWPRLLTALAGALFLAACGGGGGGSGSSGGGSTAQTATVAVALTDAPDTQWDEALATISRITLIGGPGQQVVFSGEETVDLLRLADYSEVFAVREDVPVGSYSKIRLQLDDLVLRDLDPDTGALLAEERPKIVGNGKLDLNPRGPIVLAGGATVVITLDFDVAKSLKITETGSGMLILRPVIFVDISTNLAEGLARVHGEVSEINLLAGTFRLCQTRLAVHDHDDGDEGRFSTCLRVETDGDTGLFGPDGLPVDLAALADGDRATVIGRLRPEGFDSDDDPDERFSLLAVTVEQGSLGTFPRVRGTVASAWDAVLDRLSLNADAAQDPIPAGPLTTQLFAGSRVFHEDGTELTKGDLAPGQRALVDAVLVPGATEADPDILRGALVVVRDDPDAELVLEGTVVSVDPVTEEILVTTAGGDRCVAAAGAEVYLVEAGDDGVASQAGSLADLAPGQALQVFGSEDEGGCFTAAVILAEADLP